MSLRGHKTAAATSGQTVRFLVALVGPIHVAFPAHWVRGIITLAEAGREGLVTWANSSYERTDLAGRLTIGAQMTTAETRIILYGNDQRSRSFMVDGVLGLVDVDRSQVQPLPPQFRGGERDRLLGLFSGTAYVALIANPFWVLELPPRKNALDAFVFQASERRAGEFDSRLRLSSATHEDAVPTPAGHKT
ncbi:MAG: chemotaxis protein CheW [Nitrospira defluvii]|nr:chemotaxis protein CheW [Nitrospira defluvii]